MKVEGKVRFRMILATDGDHARWYAARETMPPEVRQRCDQALGGPNAATFVIAEEGAEEKLGDDWRDLKRQARPRGLHPKLIIDLTIVGLLGLGLWCLATLR